MDMKYMLINLVFFFSKQQQLSISARRMHLYNICKKKKCDKWEREKLQNLWIYLVKSFLKLMLALLLSWGYCVKRDSVWKQICFR